MRTSDLNPTVQLMVGLARRWELFFRTADGQVATDGYTPARDLLESVGTGL